MEMESTMTVRPRLSLCIPTYNRADYLEAAILSGLGEAASLPPGTLEVLVCDNASTDGTADLIARLQATHPDLRAFRAVANQGFDGNYLRCMEEAHGEFVWILGDDDEWLPGCAARVLRELDAGADACLCLAQACDLALNPVCVLPWYLESDPPAVWHLERPEDLIRYFDSCARNAGAFAFISVGIIRRDRFLQYREALQRGMGTGYVHLWAMMAFLRQPTALHYVPEVLVRNRLSALHGDSYANQDLFGRWMFDLVSWAGVADAMFGDDPGLHEAFSLILGRNHYNTILPGMRMAAASEDAWRGARPYLLRAGFSPVRIAAVEFAHQQLHDGRYPMPTLNPGSLTLVDLPLVARGAQHIALLALGGMQNIIDGAGLLATLVHKGWAGRCRIFCPPECAELLDGFSVHCMDPRRYVADAAYRESVVKLMIEFAPELAVNLDPERNVQTDDLVLGAHPAGAIAFELPATDQTAAQIDAAKNAYTCLVPGAGGRDLHEALGLEGSLPALWPSLAARREAETALQNLGWDPGRTLAVLVDNAAIAEDPAFQSALAGAARARWTLLGIGGRGNYRHLEAVLEPWADQAVNFAGAFELGSVAALLQLCGGYLGGTHLLRSMADACGCPPLPGPAAVVRA